MRAEVRRFTMAHPGDVSALAAAIDRGEVTAASIVAIIGKTEGNGGVNDFTRGYFTQTLMLLLAQTVIARVLWSEYPAPSLVLPMVLYMSVGEFSLARGVSIAFVLGYLTDVFSGGSLGLWTFTLVGSFLLARVAGLKLFLHGVVFQVVLTVLASCVGGVTMMGLLLLFDRARPRLPVIARILRELDAVMFPSRGLDGAIGES